MSAPIGQLDERLKIWATDTQIKYIDAVNKEGSIRAAARALGINFTSVNGGIKAAQAKAERAALKGYAPGLAGMDGRLSPVEVLKGRSIYHDPQTGKDHKVWIKTDVKQEAYNEMVKAAISEFLEDVPPLPVTPSPIDVQSDIIPWIQIGDAHIGMLAHAAETGENFDLKIAERELCGAIAILIDEMPNCERIVINDLGDATHYDNMAATTAASNHALDADGRHPKMLRVYSRVMRFIVERVLTKAAHVDVIINQGNHSRVNDFWMRELLSVAYGHTGRVHVLDNDNVFIGYRMGNTFVMVHHSDKCRPQHLVGVMTTDFRKDFGETEHHLIDIGHVHHHYVSKEHPGVVIESWNHLAPNDKWANDAGYRARKSITVVLRSKRYGDVGRRVLPIQEIRDRLERTEGAERQPARAVYSV